jgi:hypothetical protein
MPSRRQGWRNPHRINGDEQPDRGGLGESWVGCIRCVFSPAPLAAGDTMTMVRMLLVQRRRRLVNRLRRIDRTLLPPRLLTIQAVGTVQGPKHDKASCPDWAAGAERNSLASPPLPHQASERMANVERLRIIAMLEIVTFHAGQALDTGTYRLPIVAGLGLPIFLILNNAFNCTLSERMGARDFLKAKLTKLLLPWLVWSAVYALVTAAEKLRHHESLAEGFSPWMIDQKRCDEQNSDRGFQVNPWGTHNRFIVSYQTFRRPEYRDALLNLLDVKRKKSLLVLDEAHTAAPSTASK